MHVVLGIGYQLQMLFSAFQWVNWVVRYMLSREETQFYAVLAHSLSLSLLLTGPILRCRCHHCLALTLENGDALSKQTLLSRPLSLAFHTLPS